MDERPEIDVAGLDRGPAQLIDSARRRFAADWSAGVRPSIDDYLADVALEHRTALRAELAALEKELCRQAAEERPRGEKPSTSATDSPASFAPLPIGDALTFDPDTAPTVRLPDLSRPAVQEAVWAPPRDPALNPMLPINDDITAGLLGETPTAGHLANERIRYFGDYEILREVARGGMGIIYQARQISLNRKVAIKMIRAGELADESDVRRFYIEAEAAANLDHPGIVPIFEVGEHEGQHYFSMGFIEGQSLAQRLAEGPLPSRQAALLLRRVAEAIEYAHARGVVHRDLKPSNILVDANGNPRVTDFGVAKKVQSDSGLTSPGEILGTPSYMPPEQARGKQGEVGPAADVYALGATLYCLVTGRPPFQASSPLSTVYQVLHADPVPPRQLNPALERDLETICLKCLEKDPSRRYGSAAALGEDLGRFLAHEPILARPETQLGRVLKWARRRPAMAGMAAALTFALVGGITGMAQLWLVAEYNAGLAQFNEKKVLQSVRAEAVALAAARTQMTIATDRAENLRRQDYVSRVNLAFQECKGANVARALELLEGCPADLRSWEWDYVSRQCHLDLHTFRESAPAVNDVAFSPDGRFVASGSGDFLPNQDDIMGALVVRDVETGREVFARRGLRGGVFAVEFSPDGSGIAVGYARQLTVFDLDTGAERFNKTGPGPFPIECLAFSPDGRSIVAGYGSLNQGGIGSAQLVDAATGAPMGDALPGHDNGVWAVAYSPDGRQVALTSADLVEVWDVATRKPVLALRGHSGFIYSVVFSRDGRYLASAGMDKTVKLWDRATGRELRSFAGHEGFVRDVAFSPDSRRIASVAEDKTVKLWSVSSDRELATLYGHQHYAHCVAFSPDGHRIASGSWDQTTKLWFATPNQQLTFRGHDGWVRSVAFGPDSHRVASGSYSFATGRFLQIWDTMTGERIQTFPGVTIPVYAIACSPDGRRLATAGLGETVGVWEIAGGQNCLTIKEPSPIPFIPVRTASQHRTWVDKIQWGYGAIRYAPDGRHLAVAGDQNSVKIYDAQSGQEIRTLEGHTAMVHALAFSPDGRQLASAGDDRTVKVWDVDTGRAIHSVSGHKAAVYGLAFSPDHKWIASVGGDFQKFGKLGEAMIWDASTGRLLHELRGHNELLCGAAFAPDGRRLATAGVDRTIKLWDTATGQEVFSLRGHSDGVISVAFSPDGQRIVSGSIDYTAKVWDTAKPTAGQLLRREASTLVADLFHALLLKTDVIAQIRRDPSPDESLRALALEIAQRSVEDPNLLNDTSWLIAQDPRRTHDDYSGALRYAQVATQFAPEEGTFLKTKGVAHYRLGQYREALTDLGRSLKRNATRFGGPLPGDLAFIAMAQHQLGQSDRARQTLEQLREVMKMSRWSDYAESKAFLAEAVALIGGSSDSEPCARPSTAR